MSAPAVIRCPECSLCAAVLPAGFESAPYLHCTETGRDVGRDDGCTFGVPGRPAPGTVGYDVVVADRKSVV